MRYHLIPLVALAGCASIPDLREKPATMSITTEKSVFELESCVMEKWSHYDRTTIPVRSPSGVALYLDKRMLLDIRDEGNARRLTVHKVGGPWLGVDKRLEADVQACV